jgi:hypothetical protein
MSAQVLVEEIDGAPTAQLKTGVFPHPARGDTPRRDIGMEDSRLEAIDGIRIDRMGIDGIGMSAQVLVEEIDGALPGQLCGSLVIARRGIVVEAVMSARIGIGGVIDMIGLQGGFKGRATGV